MDQLSILLLKTSRQMNKQGESNNLIFMQIRSLQEDLHEHKQRLTANVHLHTLGYPKAVLKHYCKAFF